MPTILAEASTFDWSTVTQSLNSGLSDAVTGSINLITGILPTVLIVVGVSWGVKKSY